MVTFNGVDLNSISPTIRIEDVMVSASPVTPTVITPAIRDGNIYARSSLGERSVSISFVVLESDNNARSQVLRNIAMWALSNEPKSLIVPQVPNGYLNAFCSGLPNNTARDYWSALTLTFTACDPYYYALQERKQQITTDPIVVAGMDAPPWRIVQQLTEPLASPLWALGDEMLLFSGLTAGQLTLDSNTQTAYIGSASALPSLMLGSRFFQLKHGDNLIDLQSGAGGTIYWRERWL